MGREYSRYYRVVHVDDRAVTTALETSLADHEPTDAPDRERITERRRDAAQSATERDGRFPITSGPADRSTVGTTPARRSEIPCN